MTLSVWRYSHLTLAVSSFLLLTLAAVTGIILSFEPVSEKLQSYHVAELNQLTLAQTLPQLRKTYPDISELTVDANQFVQIKASDAQGKDLIAYVDPVTGKALGLAKKKSEFFEWVRSLHRSLFLHETGRFFIGLSAFLLFLIAVSGTILIVQRQRGFKRFFTRILRDSFAQYYHVLLGRLLLIPILIIATTGTYLSLARFGFFDIKKASAKIDFDAIRSKPEKQTCDIEFFKMTKLSEVESIEFPFSEDAEDFYTLKLNDREVTINQITGDILSEVKYPKAVILSNLSLDLHTGRSNAIWAIVLAIASFNILFFIYSGFVITYKRMVNRIANKNKSEDCQFIILVGSENGSTFSFAKSIHQQLLKQGKKSFITDLNNYSIYPLAEHIIVMTSTYGIGDPPANGFKFASLVHQYPQIQLIHYSVLGFGSHLYPDFCKFAFETNQLLSHQQWCKPLVDIHTVNDRSPKDFEIWAEAWSQQSGVMLSLSSEFSAAPTQGLSTFMVSHTTVANMEEETFLLRIKPKGKLNVTSGDLLAIYPADDHRERLYSIGVINKEIQLSVRLHPKGIGSGFLHRLTIGDKMRARIITNANFHFPQEAPEVVMISNGTGIAPFLGMISQNRTRTPCYLYCGFRDGLTYQKHEKFLSQSKTDQRLIHLHVAFSREKEKQYVGDLILRDADFMANILGAHGIIMICGSLVMQKDVMDILAEICLSKTGQSLSFYQSHNQILTDCY